MNRTIGASDFAAQALVIRQAKISAIFAREVSGRMNNALNCNTSGR